MTNLARGGALSMFGAGINAVFGFLLTVVIARSLGTRGAGIFFAATALFNVVAVSGKLGADTGLVREMSRLVALERGRDLRRAVAVAAVPVAVVTGLVALVLWAVAPWIAALMFEDAGPVGVEILRGLALVVPFASLSVVAAGGSRGLEYLGPMVGIENIAKPVARVVLCGVAGLFGLSVTAVTRVWLVPVVVGCGAAAWMLSRHVSRTVRRLPRSAPTPWRDLASGFWSFAGYRGVASTIDVVSLSVGIFVVSALAGSHEAGVFAGVMRWVVAGTLGLQAVRLVIAPQLSGMLARGDLPGAQHLHEVSTIGVLAMSGPFYAVLAVFAGPVLTVLGEDFRDGTAALVVLSLAMLVNVATGNVQTVLLMSGRSGVTLSVVVVSLSLNLLTCVLLVPALGVTGAALGWGVAIVVENICYLTVVRRRIGIRTITPSWVHVLLLTAVCYAVPGGLAAWLWAEDLVLQALVCVLSTCAYLALVLRRRAALGLDQLVEAARSRGRGAR